MSSSVPPWPRNRFGVAFGRQSNAREQRFTGVTRGLDHLRNPNSG
jgi:hypothetical protein